METLQNQKTNGLYAFYRCTSELDWNTVVVWPCIPILFLVLRATYGSPEPMKSICLSIYLQKKQVSFRFIVMDSSTGILRSFFKRTRFCCGGSEKMKLSCMYGRTSCRFIDVETTFVAHWSGKGLSLVQMTFLRNGFIMMCGLGGFFDVITVNWGKRVLRFRINYRQNFCFPEQIDALYYSWNSVVVFIYDSFQTPTQNAVQLSVIGT